MKRILSVAIILSGLSVAAFSASPVAPLPLPAFSVPAEAVSSLPEPAVLLSAIYRIDELWSESPEPAGLDPFLPGMRTAELWSSDPAPTESDFFTPFARLSDLWSLSPSPAFDLDDGRARPSLDFSVAGTFAQAAVATDAAAVDEAVLRGLLNNEHYRDSLRLKRLALEAFEYGDYDASAGYAADAAAAARRSDDYVALRLKIRAVDIAIAEAKARLDWAASVNAQRTYAARYAAASAAYNGSVAARAGEDYDLALLLARQAVSELAAVKEIPPLPARYTVRPWAETKDCFWTIAGYSWVYGDPTKWPVLYEANKSRLPRPDNPNLVRIGFIMSIPSLKGEFRDGMWEKGRVYSPLSGLK